MQETDEQFNEDAGSVDIASELIADPEDDSVLELKDDDFTDDSELNELYLGER
jgi:hypothetical protein